MLLSYDTNIRNRVFGCIFGGAIGDAMGGPFEGKPGPLMYIDHEPWVVSDETQLTLATCESIAQHRTISPEQIASQLALWFTKGQITGMGSSTLKALRDLKHGLHWALAGARGERSAGNGAAMRIAPLAFYLNPENEDHQDLIRDVCRITHHHDEAYVGALAIIAAIRSTCIDTLIPDIVSILPDTNVRDRLIELGKFDDDIPIHNVAAQFGASGYVADSVPLAIYASRRVKYLSFEEILRKTIEAGGDTDTIASMTGQIIGSWIGIDRIPKELVDNIPDKASIETICREFCQTLNISENSSM